MHSLFNGSCSSAIYQEFTIGCLPRFMKQDKRLIPLELCINHLLECEC